MMDHGAVKEFNEKVYEALYGNPYGLLLSTLSRTMKISTPDAKKKLKSFTLNYDIGEDGDGGVFLLSQREKYIQGLKRDLRRRVGGKIYINGKRFA